MTDSEAAYYLAAMIDGEGCVTRPPAGNGKLNPRGLKRPKDGRGKGKGVAGGKRGGRNTGGCTKGGPGGGKGGGRGGGKGRAE